jgi:hypothetical protein
MTTTLLDSVIQSDQDFEWYPTTDRMIAAVKKRLSAQFDSIMDIGAGDGRVLVELGTKSTHGRKLYSIEKSSVLVQAQPDEVIPVGTDLFEQNLSCLQVDYIFCNPPYSQFEAWASVIIESGYAQKAFLVIPRRWIDSKTIAGAMKKRGAKAKVIHSDDFQEAERRARAVIDIIEISYPLKDNSYRDEVKDPFDAWFDEHVSTFDQEKDLKEDAAGTDMARLRKLATIGEMVEAFDEEYARMEANYRAIFKLDYAILKELGIEKENVREGIKKRMAGLKTKYWQLLFEKLDTITSRLSTKTKSGFIEKLTGRTAIAFTTNNAYAVVLWAIKNANKYFAEQLIQLFRELSTFEGVSNYKSNQKTWEKDGWRYQANDHSHYALDYRIVLCKHAAIFSDKDGHGFGRYDYPGNLEKGCHEIIDDIIAVMGNMGFSPYAETPSRVRYWGGGEWQDWMMKDGNPLFQVKAYKNGNLHLRFKPEAIKTLNVEAGRLMGWIRSREDVVSQLGYTPEESQTYYGASQKIGVSNIKLLGCADSNSSSSVSAPVSKNSFMEHKSLPATGFEPVTCGLGKHKGGQP